MFPPAISVRARERECGRRNIWFVSSELEMLGIECGFWIFTGFPEGITYNLLGAQGGTGDGNGWEMLPYHHGVGWCVVLSAVTIR